VASGGILVYAFPRAYSAGFSGFYMPLMMALWLLIMRGVSIELRSHEASPLWRSFFDGLFFLSSTLMAVILGAALGNVIRGVPLDETGFFSGPLFTNFAPGPRPGVLDWYTVTVGVFTLAALAGHGALYLAWKTSGPVNERSRRAAVPIWTAVVVLLAATTFATAAVRPDLYQALLARPWTWPLVPAIAGCLAGVFVLHQSGRELPAFLCSAGFLVSLLAATALGHYPRLLLSTLDHRYDLTIANASAGGISLQIGIVWWSLAIVLAIGYFTYLFRSFRGKVQPEDH
jgi:cytochrome d ubiquinol oxidase subunit II